MRKIRAVVVGYGNRGGVYAEYSLCNPTELEIVGVVDPNGFCLNKAKETFSLQDSALFKSFKDFLKSGIECDLVINATVDQLHYETALEIINAGFDMLIEKPIVPNEKQLKDIYNLAIKKNVKVFVGHVLRYTPFYKTIKQIVYDGEIGDIISMELCEHVGLVHYATSYVRGKWRNNKECGSGFLLAKSCHDIDIACWLNNDSIPEEVVSLGGRKLFVKENKPENATEYCYNCPLERTCPYSAIRQYVDNKVFDFLVWQRLDKKTEDISREEMIEFLKHDVFGKCVYSVEDADITDRQTVSIMFKNGSICNFTLVGGGGNNGERKIHIVGKKGELFGSFEKSVITVRKLYPDKPTETKEIDVSKEIIIENGKDFGHGGGDYAIMKDLIAYLNGDKNLITVTTLKDSVVGHLCVYGAEKSRKTGKKVKIKL